ncbi:MAG: hypothetical protein ACREVK_02200 [Gammaproteobacteria bacterium]
MCEISEAASKRSVRISEHRIGNVPNDTYFADLSSLLRNLMPNVEAALGLWRGCGSNNSSEERAIDSQCYSDFVECIGCPEINYVRLGHY